MVLCRRAFQRELRFGRTLLTVQPVERRLGWMTGRRKRGVRQGQALRSCDPELRHGTGRDAKSQDGDMEEVMADQQFSNTDSPLIFWGLHLSTRR